MSKNYILEQCVKVFLELGCPMPIDLEAVIACEGSESEPSPSQRVEKVDTWQDDGDWIAMSKASA